MSMIRTNFCLPEILHNRLFRHASKEGVSAGMVARIAIVRYLDDNEIVPEDDVEAEAIRKAIEAYKDFKGNI